MGIIGLFGVAYVKSFILVGYHGCSQLFEIQCHQKTRAASRFQNSVD